MNGAHLNDETVQAFALDERYDDVAAAAHLAGCETCREAVASYRMMFSDIAAMPAAEFDFDVKALVLPQLRMQVQFRGPVPEPAPTPSSGSMLKPVLVIITVAVMVLAGVAYIFSREFGEIAGRSLPYLLYCLGPAAVLLLVWMVSDVMRAYRQKMTRLEYH